MTRNDGEEPIRRALLDIVHSARGLAVRARGVSELGAQDGRPMDPMIQKARELATRLETAGETLSMFEGQDLSFRIERKENERGDERIVIRCVNSVLEEAQKVDQARADAPTDQDRADLRGNCWSVPVPDLLAFFESLNKTGTLVVSTFNETFTIVLEEGRVVHAYSDGTPIGLRLGDILVQQGATTLPELRAFISSHANDPECLGETALADGLVSREDLEQALEFQIKQLIQRLFNAQDGTYTFYDGTNKSPRVTVRMNLARLLLESSLEIDESARRG